jgi:PTH1 family peptidyl-tRNA hydrolase
MIAVYAKGIVSDNNIKEFINYASELIYETRKEEGVVSYELIRGVDNKNLFAFFEKWESKDALDAHMNTEHFKSIVPKMGKFVDGEMQVVIHEVIV